MVTTTRWAEAVIMLMLAGLPTAAVADDALKVVAAPKEFIGQQVTVGCLVAYAQEESPTWCEVYDGSGKEAGTILFYLINVTPEDRARAMQDCGNQNPRKNNHNRCLARITGRANVSFQKAFLSDPIVEWASK